MNSSWRAAEVTGILLGRLGCLCDCIGLIEGEVWFDQQLALESLVLASVHELISQHFVQCIAEVQTAYAVESGLYLT